MQGACRFMKHKRIFIDATAYTFSGYIVLPLSLISSLFVKKTIGPYLVGVMGTLNLLLFYASFCHLGVLNTAERDLLYCLGRGDTRRFDSISRTTFSLNITSGFLFACGMAGCAVWS